MLRRLLASLVLLSACTAGSSSDSVTSPVQQRMFRHFAMARDMRTFSVSGDLVGLQEVARDLERLDETWGMPPGSERYLASLREAARRTDAAAGSRDLRAATRGAADVARICGDCHVATQADLGTRFQTVAPYTADPAVRHQNYLSWASRLLWDGLIGPSERTWSAGAAALADDDGYPLPRGSVVSEAANAEAGRRLRALGEEARAASDPQDRARLVAAVWRTCGACHQAAGVR